jgi:hypothetical protein
VTIYLATAEGETPGGGVYHGDALRPAADRAGVDLIVLVKDRSPISADKQHLVATPADVRPQPGDVLVVTSAQRFPADCAKALPQLPRVASSLTSLVPQKTPWADELDLSNRAVAVTAESELAWPEFATAVGLPADHPYQVVGSPRVDTLPAWHPPAAGDRRVAVPTLVRGEPKQVEGDPDHPQARLGRAAAEFPLQAAVALRDAGYEPVICPHPREDLAPYQAEGLQISDRRTIATVAGDEQNPGFAHVVGNGGSLNAELAALSREENGETIGPKVVALTYEGQTWPPAYVYAGCAQVSPDASVVQDARDGKPVSLVPSAAIVSALDHATPASVPQAEAIVGPRGGAADRLVAAWAEAGRTAAQNDVNRFIQVGGTTAAPGQAPTARPDPTVATPDRSRTLD